MPIKDLKETFSNCLNTLNQSLIQNPEHADMSALQQAGGRDYAFDVLKGLAIILMIIGHCNFSSFRAFIYSFHMPLFFFVTGYFLKDRPLRKELVLSTKRLIIPYIFTAFWLCVATACIGPTHLKSIVVACLLGFRAQYVPDWIEAHVGLLWFILAMFWARIITSILVKRIKSDYILSVIFFLLALVGIFLNKRVFVPFCIPQGMCAAGFLFAGHLIKKYKFLESGYLIQTFPFLLIIWAYNWSAGGVDMYCCYFSSGYIFDLIGALGAFVALYILVKQCFNRNSFLWRSVHFWGRYSLIIYCAHSVEHSAGLWRTVVSHFDIPLDNLTPLSICVRMSFAFFFTFLLLKIRPIREYVFQIKT